MPTPAYLFVDGHSVMHAWPELKRDQRHAGRRHLARLELMKRLRTYQDMSGKQVVVVFDGTHSKRTEEREPNGLQIIYAEAATTADAILERLASRYGRTHSVEVVSADGMVRETILASGAGWTSPEMLKSLCDDADRQVGKIIAKNKSR
ncbi:NYN domain-containing protein [Prosthecobacter sp. SYSU 5D2]|uniref:NYN domain-containing protein n=1 Tax=Prosthecobacter sp. SYSU 5D2 TaxID=3134134 RepID=UPI0031FF1EA1